MQEENSPTYTGVGPGHCVLTGALGNIVIRSLLLFLWGDRVKLTLVGGFRGLVKERNSRFSGRHSLGRQVVE